ncbi:cysteine synthase A [Thermoactinomyces vulgaris]|uniref:cysteine synthase A n=1 Tax=Thermoactinomyces TaxID=2023 RepID=UPI0006730D3A|nr:MULTISPECIES: cysteine synthase A [Thermoactinomyces]MBH8582847.1 cysteine synthase A [Thermoactinomyces sp. CICC 10735]MCF6135072.1 cysteine synthase A [Thermoactinomyces vulgaris]QBK13788.1 cysteine synthase A [Thermoactinomyces vulgaris]
MERTRQQRVSVAENILELVGRTPMVKLNRLVQPDWADVYVKLEKFNPGGSVKDRTALNLILDAEKRGVLKPGATIIEPTSGNTGIGLALVGAARNYETILVMPDNMSQERIKLLKGYGAKVVLTPGRERMPGAIKKAEELAKEIPNSFMPYQFQNEANPEVHRNTTGPEILEKMEGKIDAFVATAGTGGTITGTGEYLKSHLPDLFIAVVEPENSPVLAGGKPGPHQIPGTSPGFIPPVLNQSIYDEIFHVSDEDAIETTRKLASQEALLVGPSSGASVWTALQVAKRLGKGKKVVCMAPDTGERYLSANVFDFS